MTVNHPAGISPKIKMDYSYFNAAPTSYNFLGLPPTPDTTNAPNSEEAYSNGSPPVNTQP